MVSGFYRSRAQCTDRLLSSTLATMSSMAVQSSLLRMLPVLSDMLAVPCPPKGSSSSLGDKSYQNKKHIICNPSLRKNNGAWTKPSKDSRVAHLPTGKGNMKGIRAVLHLTQLGTGTRSEEWTEWIFIPVVQLSVLTKSRKILKGKCWSTNQRWWCFESLLQTDLTVSLNPTRSNKLKNWRTQRITRQTAQCILVEGNCGSHEDPFGWLTAAPRDFPQSPHSRGPCTPAWSQGHTQHGHSSSQAVDHNTEYSLSREENKAYTGMHSLINLFIYIHFYHQIQDSHF